MSDRVRDRATQLVVVEASVDFTKHTLLLSAHEHEQIERANERMVIVTDKYTSAVNCPMDVGIEPFSWLLRTSLSISQSAHCYYQHTNTNRETANETIVIVTDKDWSAVNCPIKVEIVPLSWLLSRDLLISQRTHCCHQHTNTNKETAQTRVL